MRHTQKRPDADDSQRRAGKWISQPSKSFPINITHCPALQASNGDEAWPRGHVARQAQRLQHRFALPPATALATAALDACADDLEREGANA
jgi:hypothetical protein